MSNLTRLQAVSSSLDTAITKAENLPDAGGGGGGSVETCSVVLDNLDWPPYQVVVTRIVDGAEEICFTEGDIYTNNCNDWPLAIDNVKCGSAIVFEHFCDCVPVVERFVEATYNNALLKCYRSSNVDRAETWTTTYVFKAPMDPNSSHTITMM